MSYRTISDRQHRSELLCAAVLGGALGLCMGVAGTLLVLWVLA